MSCKNLFPIFITLEILEVCQTVQIMSRSKQLALSIFFPMLQNVLNFCGIAINLFNNFNRQEMKNIALIFTLIIKMLCSPISIFVGPDIALFILKQFC